MRDNQSAIGVVRRRMAEEGWSAGRLAKEAGVSENTVRTFLAGRSWPVMATLGRLEKALGWPAGRLEDLALGIEHEEPSNGTTPPTSVAPQLPPVTEIDYRGWRFTFQAAPGATPEQIRKAEAAVLDTALARLRELGLDEE